MSPHLSAAIDPDRVILEIRPGVGGAEAMLFAGDLERMYLRHALRTGWSAELLTSVTGGARESVIRLRGAAVRARLRGEAGVQCLQRVSPTDGRRRVHTSTATVAVLPEPTAAALVLRAEDLRVETMRAGGHGGQGVNRTDSAVRITHLPSGVVASCQDERSQHRNRERALAVLRARLYARDDRARSDAREADRRSQILGAERAERMRTYDVPEDQLVDRRSGLRLRGLKRIFGGDIARMLDASQAA